MAKINWQLDPAHTEVTFKVRHMMVSNVTGQFHKFDVQAETEGHDFTTAKVVFTADIDSINTKVEQRDNHLKGEDFFDAANHPQLKFESTKITKKDDDEFEMEGNLTIRGTTKPVTLKVESNGIILDPYGNHRAGFEVTGKINRLDYGLKYNPVMEAGGLVVGDEVKFNSNIELVHTAE